MRDLAFLYRIPNLVDVLRNFLVAFRVLLNFKEFHYRRLKRHKYAAFALVAAGIVSFCHTPEEALWCLGTC